MMKFKDKFSKIISTNVFSLMSKMKKEKKRKKGVNLFRRHVEKKDSVLEALSIKANKSELDEKIVTLGNSHLIDYLEEKRLGLKQKSLIPPSKNKSSESKLISIFKKLPVEQTLTIAEEKDKLTIDKFSASKLNKGTNKNIPHLVRKPQQIDDKSSTDYQTSIVNRSKSTPILSPIGKVSFKKRENKSD